MPLCHATKVVARDRRTAPFGATSPPQANAGRAWKANSPKAIAVAIAGTRNFLRIVVIVGSSFFSFPLVGYIHYDATAFGKVPLFRAQMRTSRYSQRPQKLY